VIDIRAEDSPPFVMINPTIVERSEETEEGREGCLSIPGYVCFKVPRAKSIRLTALDHRLEPFEMTAEGLLARAIQHEYDHLDGVLYPDRLASLADMQEIGDPVAWRTAQTMARLYPSGANTPPPPPLPQGEGSKIKPKANRWTKRACNSINPAVRGSIGIGAIPTPA